MWESGCFSERLKEHVTLRNQWKPEFKASFQISPTQMMQTELKVMTMNKDYKFSLCFVYVFVCVYVYVSFWGKGV